ncbi:Unknown protein [Striga hermonthica]|uniref:CCHC-type domain-containing protein n=1 Tax=Striga hermonthica TaxID=68872 RepID=A0A9N7N6R8_STRHE|nr:Unknown protein [Striga hermonthica]
MLSLIGKIVGEKKKIKLVGLKSTINVIWRTEKPFSVRPLKDYHFQLIFQLEEDKSRILNGRVWSFDGQYLLLKEWKKGETEFKKEELLVDLWVQIHNLTLHWISTETGVKAGNVFDSIKDVIIPNSGNNFLNGNVVRILASINLLEPIPRGTILRLGPEAHWIDFRYENLLTFCFYCGRIGHNERTCSFKKDDILGKKFRTGQFGEWLRCPFFSHNIAIDKKSSSGANRNPNSESSKDKFCGTTAEEPNDLENQEGTGSEQNLLDLVEDNPSQSIVEVSNLAIIKNADNPQVCAESPKEKEAHIESMDLDMAKNQDLDLGNLVNVPIAQSFVTSSSKKPKLSFTRITRSKVITQHSLKSIHPGDYPGDSSVNHSLKRKSGEDTLSIPVYSVSVLKKTKEKFRSL